MVNLVSTTIEQKKHIKPFKLIGPAKNWLFSTTAKEQRPRHAPLSIIGENRPKTNGINALRYRLT